MPLFKKVDSSISAIKLKFKPAISFSLSEEKIKSYVSSFIGDGEGYIPEGFTPPENMKLILQINFEEMPKLEGYPEEGILQVWCSGSEMFYRNKDNEGKVIFHKDTKLPQQKIEIKNKDLIEDPFYLEKPLSIIFNQKVNITPSLFTNDFEQFEEELTKFEENEDTDAEDYFYEKYEEIENPPHYIGGFPYFTQNDVREEGEITILQLGYCDHLCIGDAGSFQIVIPEEDFKNLNFDNAFCNWDCH